MGDTPGYAYRNVGTEDNWPLLLAGPIVRRVTRTSVAVFVATSRRAEVTLSILDGTGRYASALGPAYVSDPTPTRAVGKRLHVLVVRIEGIDLEPRVIYGYDVSFDDGGESRGLRELGLLGDEPELPGTTPRAIPLGYKTGHFPSFVLPEPRETLRLVYMSCRKPHGGGPDMFPTVDDLLLENWEFPHLRPQQLLLTGDQIYADDVAVALLHNLGAVGRKLLDWKTPETLPLEPSRSSVVEELRRVYEVFGKTLAASWTTNDVIEALGELTTPGRRDLLLHVQGVKPVSDYNQSHLLYFHEWCAMYLMAWSDTLWKPNPNYSSSNASGKRYVLNPITDFTASDFGNRSELLGNDTTTAVLDYAHRLPQVRRALANVATYMIFDDHEITDDWYLNAYIDRILREVPLGKRIVRNGLLAYALFQDWGNDPARYGAGSPGEKLLTLCTTADGRSDPTIASRPDDGDTLLDIGVARATYATASKRLRWDYVIEGDEHRILALDTRTWRGFPDADAAKKAGDAHELARNLAAFSFVSPVIATTAGAAASSQAEWQEGKTRLNAALISSEGMKLQITDRLKGLFVDDSQLFVISAAPVVSFPLVDLLQRLGVAYQELQAKQGTETGAEMYDNEPWIGNAEATRKLFASLSFHRPVVFLSGDVHYAFAYNCRFMVSGNGPQPAGDQHFVQLCSSSARNSEPKTRGLCAADMLSAPLTAGNYSELGAALIPATEQAILALEDALRDTAEGIAEESRVEYERMQKEGLTPVAIELFNGWYEDQVARGVTMEANVREFYNELKEDPYSLLTGGLNKVPSIRDQLLKITKETKLTRSWLYSESLFDRRVSRRFTYDAYENPFVDKLAKDRFDKMAITGQTYSNDQWYCIKQYYCSVGETNIAVVHFGPGNELRHDLLWISTDGPKSFQGLRLVTRHTVKLTIPPTPPVPKT